MQNAELFSNNQTRDSSINRQYMNLLPNALFTYTLAKNRTLRVNYRSRINAPSVTQLQPVADNTNPLSIRLGSPDLKPEYSNTVNVNVNSFNPTTFRSLFALLIVNQDQPQNCQLDQFQRSGCPNNQTGQRERVLQRGRVAGVWAAGETDRCQIECEPEYEPELQPGH